MEFKGKVVIVTGGSSGIGAATAWALAERDAEIAVVASNSVARAADRKSVV